MGSTFGIPNALTNAQLTLYDNAPSPETTPEVIASNNGWANIPASGASAVAATVNAATATIMNAVGAFVYQSNSLDSAISAILPIGSYTFQISGMGGTSGVALAEIYDADNGGSPARLVNLSARALVGTGSNILIAGFAVSGNTWETVMIRGVGPGLYSTFGLTGYLANPKLVLYDAMGTVIASNSGWNDGGVVTGSSTVGAIVNGANAGMMADVGAFPLDPLSADSAMFVILPPGNYTAQLSGAGNTTGIGLIEVYEAPYTY